MADVKLTGLTTIASLAATDLVHVVDVDDTTDGPDGTSRKMTVQQILDLQDATPVTGIDFDPVGTDNSDNNAPNSSSATAAQGATADSAMQEFSDDTSPTAGGEIVMADNNISGAGSISFTQELDNGSKTTDFTIDFSTDQHQEVTLTANTMTLTLDTTDIGVGVYTLKITNGGLATLTWAAETGAVHWVGGAAPTLTSSGYDIISVRFDGTNFQLVPSLAFA
jgi:hypothetical protein